jgi:indolepyruvate ferredoxin oxidoreductase beta subunit
MIYNIVAVGVGGQGVLFLARLLGEAAVEEGLYPCIGEVHGMSQRGGTVVTTIRISDRRGLGPLIGIGRGDALIGLEPLEAARFVDMVSRDGFAVVNSRPILIKDYPDLGSLFGRIEERCEARIYDAFEIAKRAGGGEAMNMVMLGTLMGSKRVPLEIETIRAILRNALSLKCFNAGLRI